tara:strand:+ start:625 stop:882 length:258 start_codon:yes stop_codon:yes gene_type:complete
MTAVPASAGKSFKVGDLLKFKKNSWWLRRTAGFRNGGQAYNPDSLILVTKTDGIDRTGFFYGRLCCSGEEGLWTAEEFDLVSKSC